MTCQFTAYCVSREIIMIKFEFEKLVRGAIEAMPRHIRDAMDNVAFVIEKETRRKKAKEIGIKLDEVLLGLYEGVPRIKRGSGYFGVLPDKITIFQRPLEELAGGDENKLKRLIHEVVWHEIGHHLGFDEKEIRALEIKKRNIDHKL